MDLALQTLYQFNKQKLVNYMNTFKTSNITIEEVLSTYFFYDSKQHIICLPHQDKDTVHYAAKNKLGFVLAWSKESRTILKTKPQNLDCKWSSAIIEFEDMDESIEMGYTAKQNKDAKVKKYTLYDQNFLLSRSTSVVSPEELEQDVRKWIVMNNSTGKNSQELCAS